MTAGIATYQDLCVDVADPAVVGRFWSEVLGLRYVALDDGDGRLVGDRPEQTVWLNRVPEPKTVKHRVHLDVYTTSLESLQSLGATVVLPAGDDRTWTVMADPEGGEFCAFIRDELPAERWHGLGVDTVDPVALGQWWADVFGLPLEVEETGRWTTVTGALGDSTRTFDFAAVPEPKAGKNRVHWDVKASVDDLVAAGATVLRPQDDSIGWTVMADPEGNEFCAFAVKA